MQQLFPLRDGGVDATAAYDAVRHPRGVRPYVMLNMVSSVDGGTRVNGVSGSLGGGADHRIFSVLRSLADVVLVGAQTVRAEGYGPPRLDEELVAARVARGQARLPTIAVVSRTLELDWSSSLFTDTATRPLVITASAADAGARARAADVADVIVAGSGSVELRDAVARLGDRGASVVLCEGGPTLNGLLLEAGLVDELCLTLSPALVAGNGGSRITGAPMLDATRALSLAHVLEEDGFLFLRYLLEGES